MAGDQHVFQHGHALEKADVAFQLMNNVRSKIIRAYEEAKENIVEEAAEDTEEEVEAEAEEE